MRFWQIFGLVGLLVIVGGATAQETNNPLPPVDLLTVNVLNEYPHDTGAFTQGLLLGEDGLLYESTGRYGQSTLRAVDIESGEPTRLYDLPEQFFAEGLALVEDRLYQITWREQTAIVYDLTTGEADNTFEPLGVFQYSGEGWGLCHSDGALYMSNGSNQITVRDPETFQAISTYPVTLYGAFVDQINELECVDDHIYANIWQSDTIIRFDRDTGVADAVIDARGLLPAEVRAGYEGGAVLNGIAYNPQSDTFYITGKLWETLFEVEFVPAA